jgi:DNA-binding Lrp family transcriptional regulator
MDQHDNSLERRVLAVLQEGLPMTRTPYQDMARQIGVSVEELLRVLENWRQNGTIRRMGAVVNHFRMGVAGGAMVVWDVPPERRAEVGALFAGFEEVSHAYERRISPDWPYSLYTMVHGATPEAVRQTVQRMSEAAGISEYVVLSTCKELKKVAPRYVG